MSPASVITLSDVFWFVNPSNTQFHCELGFQEINLDLLPPVSFQSTEERYRTHPDWVTTPDFSASVYAEVFPRNANTSPRERLKYPLKNTTTASWVPSNVCHHLPQRPWFHLYATVSLISRPFWYLANQTARASPDHTTQHTHSTAQCFTATSHYFLQCSEEKLHPIPLRVSSTMKLYPKGNRKGQRNMRYKSTP